MNKEPQVQRGAFCTALRKPWPASPIQPTYSVNATDPQAFSLRAGNHSSRIQSEVAKQGLRITRRSFWLKVSEPRSPNPARLHHSHHLQIPTPLHKRQSGFIHFPSHGPHP